jgi:hypothetical protein
MPERFIEVPQPIDPHLRRWMLFVDGENLTIRAQEIADAEGVALSEGPFYMRDTFVWLPGGSLATRALDSTGELNLRLQRHAVRAHYYTSVVGSEEKIGHVKEALFQLGFTPKLFKKGSTTKLSAAISYDAGTDTATLDPSNSLQRGVTYKAVVSTKATDEAGNPLDQNPTLSGSQQHKWFFTVSQ